MEAPPEAIVAPTSARLGVETPPETTSEALPVVARKVVDAEPARVVRRPPVSRSRHRARARRGSARTSSECHAHAGHAAPDRADRRPLRTPTPHAGRGVDVEPSPSWQRRRRLDGRPRDHELHRRHSSSGSDALPATGESDRHPPGAATGKARGNDLANAKAVTKAKTAAKAKAHATAKAKAQAAAQAKARAEAAAKAKAAGDAAARAKTAKAKHRRRRTHGPRRPGRREGEDRGEGQGSKDDAGSGHSCRRATPIRVGARRRGGCLPRRALQREPTACSQRRRRSRSWSSGRPGASRAAWCTSPPAVPLVCVARDEDRPRHRGGRPGEAIDPLARPFHPQPGDRVEADRRR